MNGLNFLEDGFLSPRKKENFINLRWKTVEKGVITVTKIIVYSEDPSRHQQTCPPQWEKGDSAAGWCKN